MSRKTRVDMLPDQCPDLIDCQEIGVGSTVIGEAGRDERALSARAVTSGVEPATHGQYGEVASKVDRVVAVAGGDHFLVQLFARPDSDHAVLAFGADRCSYIGDPVAGDLRHEDLASFRILQCPQNHLDAILEADVEPGHGGIGDRQHPCRALLQEERNDGAARAHDIAIAHHRKADFVVAAEVVRRGEQLVGAQLRRAVEVYRRRGLVRGQRNDMPDTGIEARFDDVLRAYDVDFH